MPRLALHHLRGKFNTEADWLSRLAERSESDKPEGLKDIPLRRAAGWSEDRFWLTPPGGSRDKPDRWSANHNVLEYLH